VVYIRGGFERVGFRESWVGCCGALAAREIPLKAL